MSKENRPRHHARIQLGAQLTARLGADHQHAHLIDGAPAAVLKIGRQTTAGIEGQLLQQQARQCRLTGEGLIPASKGAQQLLQQIALGQPGKGLGGDAIEPINPDQKNQVALVIGIVEQRAQADTGAACNIAGCGGVIAALVEQILGGITDALALVLAIAFPPASLGMAAGHRDQRVGCSSCFDPG